MSDDIKVTRHDLEYLEQCLTAIIAEFEQATDNSEDLEEAIGEPYGEAKLRNLARDFEERWDDRRGKLLEGLKNVLKRTTDSKNHWSELDVDLSQTGQTEG